MIEIRDLKKTYTIKGSKEKVNALRGIDITVNDREMVAIQGRSGAGKSTLLNIIGLIESYDDGEYMLNGIDVSTLSDGKAAKLRNQRIGFVLQDYSLLEKYNVKTNVMLPLLFDKLSSREIDEKVNRALEAVNIDDLSHRKVAHLSGGQKQRVAIARAIVNDPSFILADEPTGALDTKTSGEIMELFKSLNDEGKTIIIITHDPIVADQCKRKIEISDGRIVSPEQEEK